MVIRTPIQDDPVIRRINALRPAVDEDDLSPQGRRAQAILERVLASPLPATSRPAPARRARWTRPRWALPRVGVVLSPIAASVALLAGTFSGSGSVGVQSAAAAVTRATIHALTTSGAIFIEDETYISGPSVHGHAYTIDQVLETPVGSGSQSVLTTYSDPKALHQNPAQTAWAYGNGMQEIYSRATNTIYQTSIWGSYLHRGHRPGTYIYRFAAGGPILTNYPVSVTASQARALRNGTLAIVPTSDVGHLTIRKPGSFPGYAQAIRGELKDHSLRYVGNSTIDGRAALELAGRTYGDSEQHIYLDPITHLPFAEIDQPGTAHQQVIHVRLRKLPITPTTERLVSLHALHPSARIDRNHHDYLRAANGTQIYFG